MAKPPFKFKPNKPTEGAKVELVGTADVNALYSDMFVVVNEGETGLGSIYFYQRSLSDRQVALGTIETQTLAMVAPKAKCLGRVLLSQQGIEKLLQALAENRGFTLTRKVETEK
jgi:hypothetical protein